GYESTRQQVIRLDREPEPSLADPTEASLLAALTTAGARADAFLVSDYGYGTVTPRIFETVRELARTRRAVVTVDSRYDLPRFKGATAAAPNEPEVEALVGGELGDERALEKAGRAVLERLDSRYLLVTRGSRGMALFEREGPVTFMPIHGSDQIADVTGAGDTVISAFTVALATGAGAVESAWLANVAGGGGGMKRGTATVCAAELSAAVQDDGAAARSWRGGPAGGAVAPRREASRPRQRLLRSPPCGARALPRRRPPPRRCAPRRHQLGSLGRPHQGAGPAHHDRG